MQLEGLERTIVYKQMMAVEHARDRVGAGLPEALADLLREAIMRNCSDGRKYPYERLYIVGISRAGFYRYREAFFYDIANELGLF
jgi:ACT domain-containing protein